MNIQRVFKATSFIALCLLPVKITWAGCSPHIGLVSINEISKVRANQNRNGDFIEIKRLDSGFSSSLIDTWTIEICEYIFFIFPSCSGEFSVSNATEQESYWVYSGRPFPANYIDWNDDFDISLRDENGDIVDWVSVNDSDYQDEDCVLPYDSQISSGNRTRRARRLPDGSGDWHVPPGNSEPATDGENNNETPINANTPRLGFLEDVSLFPGQTASFTLVTEDPVPMDLSVSYSTANGTGVDGIHYTGVTGTALITAGNDSALIEVDTLNIGDPNSVTFYLIIDGGTEADIYDQLAIATIDGNNAADHFNIHHSGTAVNCMAEPVTFSARDSAGNLMSQYTGTLSISTSTGNGDWSLNSGNGTLTLGGGDSGFVEYDMVSADNGQVTLNLTNTHVEIISINITDAIGITEQTNNATNSDDPELSYSASGFVFLFDDGTNPTSESIPAQTSYRPMNEALSYEPLTLRAITTDVDTGVCSGLFSGSQTIEIGMECLNPTACNGSFNSQLQVSGQNISENNSGDSIGYSDVTLTFNTNSTAELVNVLYEDVGQVKLHARYQQIGDDVIGSSQSITFLPAGFCLVVNTSNAICSGPNYFDCSVFVAAGEEFSATVTAQGWQEDGDANYCDNNQILPSFSFPVSVTHSLVSPVGGAVGSLSLNSIDLIAGSFSGDLSWSEVGVVQLRLGGNQILDEALPITLSDEIGRFNPFELFIIQHESGSFSDGYAGFTYIGQQASSSNGAISYDSIPWYEFVARNVSGEIVENYTPSDFYKSPSPTYSVTSAVLGDDSVTPLTVTAGFSSAQTSYDTNTHRHRFTLNTLDHFTFNKTTNAQVAPFTSDINIHLNSLQDSDGVSLTNSLTLAPAGGIIRYGRMFIETAFGPETQSQAQIWQAQYYDGNEYVLNTLDNQSSISSLLLAPGSVLVLDEGDPDDPLLITDSSLNGTDILNTGTGALTWSAPSGGRYGVYEFEYDVDDWLMDDWEGTGFQNPKSQVHFGRYRGNDRVIYWHEIEY